MSAESAPDGDQLSYAEALDELEDLLDDLEGADVDVDVLAQRVARGVELIRLCRARLDVVTADVDAVVAELDSLDEGAEGAEATDGSVS
ncbi:MAG: exodeoxyribonuclease VII small subunit [Actinomycetota bacterium]